MNDKFSFSYYCLVLLLVLLPILLLKPYRSGIFYNEEYKDTIIFNVTYRDTTIYNVNKKDSIVYDFTYVPLEDTIRINDTLYMSLPMSWFWFHDESVDIYCTGYNVKLDSVNYHFREVTKMVEKEITIKPNRFSGDVGLFLGKTAQCYYINMDITARLSINSKWSLTASAGVHADGDKISPFGEIRIRRKLR